MARLDSAELVVVGLLKSVRPSTGRKLAKDLGLSSATVYRVIDDLLERGLIIRLDQLPVSRDVLQSLVTNPRYMPVVVNFDRPGIEQYLAYLSVEHGVSADASRQWVDSAVRGVPDVRPVVPFVVPERADPYGGLNLVLEQVARDRDVFADLRVRDLRKRMAAVLDELESQQSNLRQIFDDGGEEQAHLLTRTLDQLVRELGEVAPRVLGTNAGVALPLLALQCHRSARVVWAHASWIWGRARQARWLREDAIRFGERAMAGVLPMNDSGGGLSELSALRDLATILERKYWGGNLDALHFTGNGGDDYFAVLLRGYARRLQELSSEIRALPALRGPDGRTKGGVAQWPLDLVELDEFFGVPLEGETVGDYEARIASLEPFEFRKVDRRLSERVAPSATFYAKPMPDYLKEQWQVLHVSVGDVCQGDVIVSIKGQELWRPVLVAHAESDLFELTYGVGDQVMFWHEWMTPIKDAFTVYRDASGH